MLYGKRNVKNLKNPEFCPTCEAARRTDLPPQKHEKVEKHKVFFLLFLIIQSSNSYFYNQVLWSVQTKTYQEQKEKVAQGQADECLVVLDFSQFSLEKGFRQVLIIVIYTHDSEAPDGLHRHYLDYVGEQNVSSDVNFVAGVWQDLMTRDYFVGINTIRIWTNGGPHHFRISANMWIISQLQLHFPHHFFIYNFFAAHHGHSVCDAVASHGKRKVMTVRRNEQRPIRTSAALVDVLGTIEHHISSPASSLPSPRLKLKTLASIRSLNCWIAPFPGQLFAWESSATEGMPTKEFDLSTFLLDDMPSLF